MARIRTIKPEFFLHEELFDLESESGLPVRIAFAGLWCQADREGRFKWRPRALKTQILPYDNCDFSRVLDALTTRGFIEKYSVQGEEYGCIPSFSDHQCINNRESESDIPSPELADTSTRAPRVPHACPTRGQSCQGEGKGREGKGKEGNIDVDNADASSQPSGDGVCGVAGEILSVWNAAASECGWRTVRDITASRRNTIRERTRSKSWRENWREAIDRIRGSPFCKGESQDGWRADLDWFLRPNTVTTILEGKYDPRTSTSELPF